VAKIAEQVWELAVPLARAMGLELVDVEFVREGGRYVLRVFIDREGGIAHSHCESMSRALDEELDKLDPIEQSYHLEVSSPGVERPLKKAEDYVRFTGHAVKIRLFAPLQGQKNYEGTLRGLEGEDVLLATKKQGVIRIPISQVAKAHLALI
jgi:ribosome maturation factor RimP